MQLAILVGLDITDLRRRYPLLKINHRSENRLFMGTLHDDLPAGQALPPSKAAPWKSWPCVPGISWMAGNCRSPKKTGSALRLRTRRWRGRPCGSWGWPMPWARMSPFLRISSDLVWLGIVGMADPIREGVGEAIRAFHRAGIETVMITGDQSPTAYAIGKELELSQGDALGNPGCHPPGRDRAGGVAGPGQDGPTSLPGSARPISFRSSRPCRRPARWWP